MSCYQIKLDLCTDEGLCLFYKCLDEDHLVWVLFAPAIPTATPFSKGAGWDEERAYAVQGKGQISKSLVLDNVEDGVDFTSKSSLLVGRKPT